MNCYFGPKNLEGFFRTISKNSSLDDVPVTSVERICFMETGD